MVKRQGPEFWRRHVEAWHQSDLTQVAYCATHGLSTKSFGRWRRREKQEAAAARSSLTLVPVSVGVPATAGAVRLHSPGGWHIELPGGASASWLADILRQLP